MTLSENQTLDSKKQTEVMSFFCNHKLHSALLFRQHITLSNVNLHLYENVSLATLASPTPTTSAGIMKTKGVQLATSFSKLA